MPGDGLPKGLGRLLELQGIDLELDRLRSRRRELEGGEEQRAARRAAEDAESRLGEARMQIDEVTREQRRMEGDVDALGRRIVDDEKRLFDGSVANVKELEGIRAGVASVRNRRSRTEDALLEVMERREELEATLPELEATLAGARETAGRLTSGSERELRDLEGAIADRSAGRERLLPEFDPDLVSLYESIRVQRRGVGAAALVDGVCQGCHEALSPVELARLKRRDGVRRCENCRRILVAA